MQIAVEKTGRPHQNLVVLGDSDLDAWQRSADSAKLDGACAVHGCRAASLGLAIYLVDDEADRGEEIEHVAGNRRRAGGGELAFVEAERSPDP